MACSSLAVARQRRTKALKVSTKTRTVWARLHKVLTDSGKSGACILGLVKLISAVQTDHTLVGFC